MMVIPVERFLEIGVFWERFTPLHSYRTTGNGQFLFAAETRSRFVRYIFLAIRAKTLRK
jgi:hypothetical protein